MKPSKLKFFVVVFLLAILGVDSAQNLAKYKSGYVCSYS